MALESFLTRWRKAVRPLGTPTAALLAQRRRQRRLIYRTLSIVVLLGAAWFIYGYWASAPDRARAEVALGAKQMGPGAYDESIRHFDRAVELWPEYAEAYLLRAVAEHAASQPGPALADARRYAAGAGRASAPGRDWSPGPGDAGSARHRGRGALTVMTAPV